MNIVYSEEEKTRKFKSKLFWAERQYGRGKFSISKTGSLPFIVGICEYWIEFLDIPIMSQVYIDQCHVYQISLSEDRILSIKSQCDH